MGSRTGNVLLCIGVLCLAVVMTGCAGMEYYPNKPAMYVHKELPTADRAVDAARKAGKDKECPAEFQAAEKMRAEAWDIYWSCRTKEAIAKANEATAKANGLCPVKAAAPAPPPPPPPPKPTPPPTPPPKPTPPPPPPPAPKVVDRLTLHINFDSDKADIRKADIPELEKAVAFVKKYPGSKISVEGYTDSRGSDKYNLGLSDRRAQAVKKYLVDKGGAKADRITAAGKGEANPVGDNNTEKGRFENRRVEVLILNE